LFDSFTPFIVLYRQLFASIIFIFFGKRHKPTIWPGEILPLNYLMG